MVVYEQCEKCEKYVEETDYFSGIGLVCKECSKKLRSSNSPTASSNEESLICVKEFAYGSPKSSPTEMTSPNPSIKEKN